MELQGGGNARRANDSSTSQVNEPHPVRLFEVSEGSIEKFMWKELPSWTMIGRWSELRVVKVRHSEFIAMWEETIVRSGEVGFPRGGGGKKNQS